MSTAITKSLFPYAFVLLSGLGLAASAPAGMPPALEEAKASGPEATTAESSVDQLLAELPPDHFDRIPPAAGFVPRIQDFFRDLERRLPIAANLAYWRTVQMDQERGVDLASLDAEARMSRYLEMKEYLPTVGHPEVDELIHGAYRARFALPYDESTRPARKDLQMGFYAVRCQLPGAGDLAGLSLNLDVVTCAFDETSDAAWAREHPAGGDSLRYRAFKIGRIKSYALEQFPGDPGCAQLFTKTAARYLKKLPPDLTPETNALLRREFYKSTFLKDFLRAAMEDRAERVRQLEALWAEAARRVQTRHAQEAADRARCLEEARVQAERQRNEARRAAEQQAMVDLAAAEAAPPSAAERAREQALRAEDAAVAEARRKLALELKRQARKEARDAEGPRVSAESKEEKKGAAALRVDWHPDARAELISRVASPVQERIDQFIRENLRAKGSTLGMPHAKLLADGHGIWELRPLGSAGAWRPLCARIGDRIVILSLAPESGLNRSAFREALQRAMKLRDALVVGSVVAGS